MTEGHFKNGPHSRLTKFASDGTFIERLGSTGQGHLQLSLTPLKAGWAVQDANKANLFAQRGVAVRWPGFSVRRFAKNLARSSLLRIPIEPLLRGRYNPLQVSISRSLASLIKRFPRASRWTPWATYTREKWRDGT